LSEATAPAVSAPSKPRVAAVRLAACAAAAGLLLAFVWAGTRGARTVEAGLPQATLALRSAGKAAALAAAFLLMAQFAMSARIKALDRAFGLDRLLRWHRVAGAAAGTLAALHPLLLYSTDLYELGELRLGLWPELVGAALLVCLGVVVATSLWRKFLELPFEAWRTIHQIAFVAVALAAVHAFARGSDLAGGWPRWLWLACLACYAGLFVRVKVVKPLALRARPLAVRDVSRVGRDTWNLVLERPHGFEYLPGQFGFLTLRRKGLPVEEHPFTISSPPTWPDRVTFTIKASGDFTRTVRETSPGDRATLDGPYGRFSHVLLAPEGRLVMIAGGVGVTPILSMLRHIADAGDDRPVLFVWGNRTEEDILFRDEIESLPRRLPRFRVRHVLSEQDDWPGEKGLVDLDLLRRVLGEEDLKAHVFLCGPPPMMKMVRAALGWLGFSRRRVHSERFEL
jgi:predicted ferric reductase